MGSRNEYVRLVLTADEMAVVDRLRQLAKARTGKLPMRARAIADLIHDASKNVPMVPTQLGTYTELIATVASHSDRLDVIEAIEREQRNERMV